VKEWITIVYKYDIKDVEKLIKRAIPKDESFHRMDITRDNSGLKTKYYLEITTHKEGRE
jgi:hypothetical protein